MITQTCSSKSVAYFSMRLIRWSIKFPPEMPPILLTDSFIFTNDGRWMGNSDLQSLIFYKSNKYNVQVVYLTFERLWNFARETFAPVWSLSKLFILTNLITKSLQKIRFQNIQDQRPHGSSIKHGGFWDFWMCRASADDQSPDIPFKIRWILGELYQTSVETTISKS